MRAILLATVVLVFLAMMLVAVPPPKVTICHVPPGNADNIHMITIDQSALPAHVGADGFDRVGGHCGVFSGGIPVCDYIPTQGGCYTEQ